MPESQKSGCLLAIFNVFRGINSPLEETPEPAPDQSDNGPLPYRRKDYLLTKAERSFFGVLQHAVNEEYLIFSKVRIGDLLYVRKGTEKRQRFQNYINQKHVDFVLCDKESVKPLLVIELDDSSHQSNRRRKRDNFVDRAMQAAELSILHIPAQQAYNVRELTDQIQSAVVQ